MWRNSRDGSGRRLTLKVWRPTRRGRNPLRRPLTRRERVTALAMALLGVFTAGLAVAAVAVLAVNAGDAVQRQLSRHEVQATVLASTMITTVDAELASGGTNVSFSEHVQWSWHGETRTGETLVVSGPLPGSTTTVWVDDSGDLVPSPWNTGDTVMGWVAAAMIGFFAVLAVAWCMRHWWNTWLFRRRAESWQAEWERVAPLWSGRRGIH